MQWASVFTSVLLDQPVLATLTVEPACQNNVAVAAQYLKALYKEKGIRRILILDWYVQLKPNTIYTKSNLFKGCTSR